KNAFLYLDTGRYGKAVNAYSAWLDRKRSSEGETLHARWAIAWCHYLQQEWQAALSAFDSVRLATGNPTWRARATYWRARTFEAMGHTAEAADLYDQVTAIAGGGGYYQALAAARRAGKAVDSLTAGKTPRRWQDRFGGSVAVAAMYADDRSRLLARRGQWALALEEAALAGSADDIELWMERLGKGWGVAPELVHLLIQRESGYRGDAISRTGDFIPQTFIVH
ncbi:MAG: hypothetical protein HYV03_08575, partial [Deltaproteobacteria bacterium]|nr:hypothetical protein [Deltaproteobacteria bacterium]